MQTTAEYSYSKTYKLDYNRLSFAEVYETSILTIQRPNVHATK